MFTPDCTQSVIGEIHRTRFLVSLAALASAAVLSLGLPTFTPAQLIEELVLGQPKTDKLLHDKDTKYYAIYVESGKHLLVVLDDTSSEYDRNELYIKYSSYGLLPTKTDYDDKYDLDYSLDHTYRRNLSWLATTHTSCT